MLAETDHNPPVQSSYNRTSLGYSTWQILLYRKICTLCLNKKVKQKGPSQSNLPVRISIRNSVTYFCSTMFSICFKFILISFPEGKFWSLTCLNLSAVWQELCSTTLNSNLSSWEMTCDTEKLHLASHLSNKVSCRGLKSFLKFDLLTHFKIRKKSYAKLFI